MEEQNHKHLKLVHETDYLLVEVVGVAEGKRLQG